MSWGWVEFMIYVFMYLPKTGKNKIKDIYTLSYKGVTLLL